MSRLSRGPQRDATLSLSPITSPSLTATIFEKPGRLATVAADTLQQIVSARKISLGSALRMYSALNCGYPASAVVFCASAMLTTPRDFKSDPTNVELVSV